MDRTTTPLPTPTLLHRASWLVLVPTVCGSGPWIVKALSDDPLTAIGPITQAVLPITGTLLVVCYRVLSPYPVRLWPFLPYAAAVAFFATGLVPVTGTEPGSEYLLIAVQLLAAFVVQPLLALAGGLVSFVAVGDRYGGLA